MKPLSYGNIVRIARGITCIPGVITNREEYINSLEEKNEGDEKALANVTDIRQLSLCSVGKVANVVATLAKTEVETKGVKSDELKGDLYSYILKYPHIFKIRYRYQNSCFNRFVNLKELMHIAINDSFLLDDTGGRQRFYAMTTEAEWIAQMAMEVQNVIPDNSYIFDKELHPEVAAFYAAIEVAFPWKLRSQLSEMVAYGDFPAALAFKMPLLIVQKIKDDRYRDISCLANRVIDEVMPNQG